MSVQEKALKIYNQLHYGGKAEAAEKIPTARWYFESLLNKVTTPKETLIKLIDAMSEVSAEATKKQSKSNTQIQKEVAKLKKELA